MSDPHLPQGPEPQGPAHPPQNYQPGQRQPPPQGWQQPGQPQQPLTHAQASAQARGAKAHAKALRPWFKKKRFLLPIGLVLLFAIIGIGGSGNDPAPVAGLPAETRQAVESADEAASSEEPTDDAKAKEEAPAEQELPGIGDTVAAGDWEFKVTKFKCGEDEVGSEYLNKKAQGQFCMLNITATNNGDDEGTIDSSSQKLTDKDGKEYSSDSEASLYEDSDSMLFLEGVNPGNTAKGLVVFDVPKKVKPTQVSLSGGFFGGEKATISLK